jgi:hypothetical protein
MGRLDWARSWDNVSGPEGEAGLRWSVKSGILEMLLDCEWVYRNGFYFTNCLDFCFIFPGIDPKDIFPRRISNRELSRGWR